MKIKLGYILLFILFQSCDDNLDLEPTDSLTPEILLSDPVNLDKLLLGAYTYADDELAGRFQTVAELLADEGDLAYQGGISSLPQFQSKQINAYSSFVSDLWRTSYIAINLCNILLENLDLEEEPVKRAFLEGEAKFLRGLLYFELARNFALPYEPGGNNNQPGVPLVYNGLTDLSELDFPGRNTLEEVYAQAISDLQDAYDLLPPENGFRADRYSAGAMLARVYLQQGRFASARDAAHDVLSNSGHMLSPELATAFNNDSDIAEDLFAWQVTSQDGYNGYNFFWASGDFGGLIPSGMIAIEDSFLELFIGPDDRAEFFYEGPNTRLTAKWQSRFANVPFIRVAEMHLIRAEANFREGTTLGLPPEDEINALRARSNAEPINGLILRDILDERRRELAFEGHRIHDAKRLKEDIDGIPYNADRLVMPIPQSEIDVNPNLEQNPGY